MITIGQPYVYQHGDKYRLESEIHNEKLNKDYKIWYEVEAEYGEYLCDELADAFLLAVLPIAADSEQDICIHANVSPKLFYAVKKVHLPFFSKFLKKKEICVFADSANVVHFSGIAVSTGCSLGVDSLSTIYQHIDDGCLPEYRLTHLALFNSCQLGAGNQEQLNVIFEKSCKLPKQFAGEIGLKFLPINTSVTELMSFTELTVEQLFHYFTISCVMALQKLFSKYIFSSSYNAENMRINSSHLDYSESTVIPLMSNENVEIILSDTFKKRTEKTEYISKFSLTPKYLDVCWSTQLANLINYYDDRYLKEKINRNCGWCDKCMRTLFTLDMLGCLSDYEDAFDLAKYFENKNDFAAKVVAKSKHDVFYQEIYEMMKERNTQIPIVGRIGRIFDVSESKLLKRIWGMYLSTKVNR